MGDIPSILAGLSAREVSQVSKSMIGGANLSLGGDILYIKRGAI